MDANGGDLAGTTLDGKYQILRRLGKGGMGVVYEALHTGINRRCAIKVLRPNATRLPVLLSRFIREALITGGLGHPNIIQVTDIGKTPTGAPYLVMEFLKGKSLAEAIDQQGPLALDWAVTIIIHVLDALAVVHHEGVIHRDLKPDNIFLAETGRPGRPKTVVKVLDFGIAKPVNLPPEAKPLTRRGIVVGTPYYMPPEQVQAQKLDLRADIFAAGVTLYEILTAAMPFEGNNFYDLVVAMLTSDPLPPSFHRPEIPPELDAVILKAISLAREDRYQNADEFLEALRPFAPAGLITSLYTSRIRVPAVGPGSTPVPPPEANVAEVERDTEQDFCRAGSAEGEAPHEPAASPSPEHAPETAEGTGTLSPDPLAETEQGSWPDLPGHVPLPLRKEGYKEVPTVEPGSRGVLPDDENMAEAERDTEQDFCRATSAEVETPNALPERPSPKRAEKTVTSTGAQVQGGLVLHPDPLADAVRAVCEPSLTPVRAEEPEGVGQPADPAVEPVEEPKPARRASDGTQPPLTPSEALAVRGSQRKYWTFLAVTIGIAGFVASGLYFLDTGGANETDAGAPARGQQEERSTLPLPATDSGPVGLDAGREADADAGSRDASDGDLTGGRGSERRRDPKRLPSTPSTPPTDRPVPIDPVPLQQF